MKKSIMLKTINLLACALTITLIFGCAPGFYNTGGSNDPRELIGVAYSRMKSDRIIGLDYHFLLPEKQV